MVSVILGTGEGATAVHTVMNRRTHTDTHTWLVVLPSRSFHSDPTLNFPLCDNSHLPSWSLVVTPVVHLGPRSPHTVPAPARGLQGTGSNKHHHLWSSIFLIVPSLGDFLGGGGIVSWWEMNLFILTGLTRKTSCKSFHTLCFLYELKELREFQTIEPLAPTFHVSFTLAWFFNNTSTRGQHRVS